MSAGRRPGGDGPTLPGRTATDGRTVRSFSLGYAPKMGEWLVQKAGERKQPFDLLEQVGLIAPSKTGSGHYCRFRDRVMFPIRDVRGEAVGFGGRILPSSPLSASGPKYYNSSETNLFSKSEQLYGIDQPHASRPSTQATLPSSKATPTS